MKNILDRYLDRVLVYADLPESQGATVRQELRDHLLQKIADLRASGSAPEDATLEALRQHGSPLAIGYGLRPFRWIDIRCQGTARGVIAIGPKAVGVVAFGGLATGVFAFGGVAFGLFAMGGFSAALLIAIGGLSAGGLAYGGFAAGLVAYGGLAAGAVAAGGEAFGALVTRADVAHSVYSAATAPGWVRSLVPLLRLPHYIELYAIAFWSIYTLVCIGMGFAQRQEGRRTGSSSDWLIEGD